jgi:hypothetical protein
MFVPTDRQRSLLECQFLLPKEKASRLRKSWAAPFRERVLPLIDEEVFRDAFSATNGRPNKSIRLLVGLHLLKEWNDLTDEQVLDQLEYNLQWHYALAVESDTAHVCQKTLHNFRVLLMSDRRAQQVFEDVTAGLARMDGLGLGRQRLDSTHVIPNIAVLTRLGLFVETVTHFLRELRKAFPDSYASLNAGYGRRYLDREGYFSDAKREQARRRLPVVARDVHALVVAFEEDAWISSLPAFALLKRLFDEQCEVVECVGADDTDASSEGEEGSIGGGGGRVQVRDPKTIPSGSLQSPHDPDVTYGHKGKGHEVQVAETCDESNPYQLITGTLVNGANESDQNAVLPMLDQLEESGMQPDTMLADTGFGSGANIVASAERGVDLHAPVQDPKAPPSTDHFEAPIADAPVPASPPVAIAGPTQPGIGSAGLLGLEWFSFDKTACLLFACPMGKPADDQRVTDGVLIATFFASTCAECPLVAQCPTRRFSNGTRQLRRARTTIATEVRQAEQRSATFKDPYRMRSGIESTNRELKSRHGLGDLRVRGKPRVHLAAVLKALALNVKRAAQWHVSLMADPALAACPA